MSPMSFTRTAVIFPSASAASSMSWIWPRPWMLAWVFSERASVHRTGFFNFRARARQSTSSG